MAQAAIGWSYEAVAPAIPRRLVHTGKLTKQQAGPLIEQAYSAVLEKYADSEFADDAAFKLAELNEQRGDVVAAAGYYRIFLELADANDQRAAIAQKRAAVLEGGSQ